MNGQITTGIILLALIVSITVGCIGEPVPSSPSKTTGPETEDRGNQHDDRNEVPQEAKNVQNPIPASTSSLARGGVLYTASCGSCHGPEGRGDGHMAIMFDPKPSSLNDAHVQEKTDGTLFYITSHGEDGTAMPAFPQISEEDMWHIVNYIRTFDREEAVDGGHAHGVEKKNPSPTNRERG